MQQLLNSRQVSPRHLIVGALVLVVLLQLTSMWNVDEPGTIPTGTDASAIIRQGGKVAKSGELPVEVRDESASEAGGDGVDLASQIVSSPAALEFLNRDSIMSNPTQDRLRKFFNGTRQFRFVCAAPKSDRIELQSMTAGERNEARAALQTKYANMKGSHHQVHHLKGFTFIDGDSFILRDVCALGHFPKELTHLFSYVWAEVLAHVDGKRGSVGHARMRAVLAALGLDSSSGPVKKDSNPNAEDPLDMLYQMIGPQLIHHLILGHRCATRTSPLFLKEATASLPVGEKLSAGHPKYTNVFHKVMAHWIRAIAFPWLATQEKEEDVISASNATAHEKLLYKDLASDGSKEELYWPLGKPYPVGDPNAPPVSFYEDYTSNRAGKVCFERVLEREERWRWFPNAEVGHRFRTLFWRYFRPLKQYHRRRLQKLTRIPFPRQEKIKVLVLRREEDRHFDEKAVTQFIQNRFGHLVEIRSVQYDRGPHAAANAVFPSYYEQMQQISSADVFIAAHGAALSSIVVMRPGAVIIELFPHNFRYYMYEELAKVLNIEYVAYEGTQVAPPRCCGGVNWDASGGPSSGDIQVNTSSKWSVAADGGDETQDLKLSANVPREERLKILSKMYDLHGDRRCKKCDIYVPMPQWYHLIKNALATVWLQNSRLSDTHDFDLRK